MQDVCFFTRLQSVFSNQKLDRIGCVELRRQGSSRRRHSRKAKLICVLIAKGNDMIQTLHVFMQIGRHVLKFFSGPRLSCDSDEPDARTCTWTCGTQMVQITPLQKTAQSNQQRRIAIKCCFVPKKTFWLLSGKQEKEKQRVSTGIELSCVVHDSLKWPR